MKSDTAISGPSKSDTAMYGPMKSDTAISDHEKWHNDL